MSDAVKTVREILDKRRSFVFSAPGGEDVSYFIADPTGEDIRKADWQYSKVFNQALADGFPTQSQMVEILKARGILDEEYTKEVEQTRIELAAALFRLDNLDPDASDLEKEGLAIETAAFRDKLYRLNQRVNGPLANTCENLAEDSRVEFLTSRIIQTQDGKRLWKDFEDFRATDNAPLIARARFEVMLWMQGLDSNFLENTPEQTVLRAVAQHRLDETLKKFQDQATSTVAEAVETLEKSQVEDIPLEVVPVAKKPKKKGRPRKG